MKLNSNIINLPTPEVVARVRASQAEGACSEVLYRGFTLRVARNRQSTPVVLVIDPASKRGDGVVEVVANPSLAKACVDRRLGKVKAVKKKADAVKSMKDSEAALEAGGGGLAAALQDGLMKNALS